MNQLPERPLVFSIRVNSIESAQTAAAQSAPAVLVERSGIQKRTSAIDAEVLWKERLRSPEAREANWNSGDVFETLAANTALIREDEVEQR
jgi:hypothetical protein